MFKFLRRHPPKDSEEREGLKKELFGFRRCTEHGFPTKPSALAYDSKLRLLAIGTKNGVIKVYGTPGVEYSAVHEEDVQVAQLYFLPEQARLISLCSDNSLHLWEMDVSSDKPVLKLVKTFSMENNKMKTISACCLTASAEQLLLGTEGGNIHMLDVKTFELMDQIIYQDVVMQNVPDDFKVNPGAVESIAVHPTNKDKFLIGYNRGLIVLWDNNTSEADQTYNATQQLESVCWNRNGEEFMSAHADGSYIVWKANDSTNPKEPALTPYGPFPCKAIGKIDWKSSKVDPFIIFSGGMPRASYGDRHTISVMQGSSNHVVFDFTSKVVDFVTVSRSDEVGPEEDRPEHDEPHTIICLVEEELVLVDLDSPKWPTFQLPYLSSLHSSAITCSQHVSNVPEQLWQKLLDARDAQMKGYSNRDWPINGGKSTSPEPITKDLLLTGHEDGSVKFWDASGSNLQFLYKLSTATAFNVDIHQQEPSNGEVEEEWPPFKKVGTFDPYSDDPRLGIQKITLCPLSETLVVAGTAGQILIMQMEREERELEVKTVTINIVGDRDNFVWKGHEAIPAREGDVKFASGFQPTCLVQVYPPAACTALAFHSEWQLVAAGTAHGFGLVDYAQKKEVLTRCTLNPHDLTGTSDTPMSRRKSLKKSLRESFRRLRRRRSERRQKSKEEAQAKDKKIEETPAAEASPSPAAAEGGASAAGTPEHKPVERAVEARTADDSMASMVRCFYFADTFIVNAHTHNPSLWVGTNGGHVYIHNVTIPAGDKRNDETVSCVLAKEIKLRHHAPVISIAVVDGRSRVLPEALEVQNERAKAPEMSSQHSVVICSEEQLKIFTLPHLKAKWKFKLTAIDGARIRKVAFVNFRSRSDENYQENDIACLSNLGDVSVYSITTLRQQLMASALKREDINGVTSFIFTKYGQAFYLLSPSEFERVTVSARQLGEIQCRVDLKEGMRPEPEPEPEPKAEEPAAEGEQAQARETESVGGEQYNTTDIVDGLNETQNESRADTTMEAEITQDSIQVIDHSNVSTDAPVEESVRVEQQQTTESVTTVTVTTVETTVESTTESATAATTAPATADGEKSENVDDDTKATQPEVSKEIEPEEKLAELKITETPQDVDDPALTKQKAPPVENGHDETAAVTAAN